MDGDILPRVIAEWVRGPELPILTPRERSLPDLAAAPRPILAVVGPRRAGKTYFLYQLIEGLLRAGKARRDDILFVDFEDYRLSDFRPEDMEKLLAAFHQITGKPPRYMFFDEIQRLPSWSRVVRTLHNTRKYSIVVTGSNATLLSSEIATELRGRYEDCLILPFSFREFLRFCKVEWTPGLLATPEVGIVLKAFDDYLRFGGFPELAGLVGEAAKRRLLQSYFDTIFYKDILDRHGIRARHLLDVVMKNILESYAATFSISAFERQLKAHGLPGSKRSIADYLRYLEEAFFLIAIEKFDFSPRKRMMSPKKVYLTDTGFSLLGGAFTENRGRLLENVVAIELVRNRRRVMHFKGKGECDFIVQEGTRPKEAWQVCWELTRSSEKREMNGLAEARRELGIKKGGLLTYNQEGPRLLEGAKIPLLPVWKWLLKAPPRA
ncbi:MAG: ATP-binding protein [Acidobacteriota bacterium]